jgi:ABC-type nitrate/sulfonate/bicarbonate transport system substrate-binding protein
MRRGRAILTAVSAMTVAVLSLAACSSGSSSAASGSNGTGNSSATTVSIGIAAPVAQYALPAIADAEKLWPSDVQVHWSVLNASTITSSIATGKIQMAIGAAPQYDAAAYKSNAPIAWIASYQDPADFQMIVRPGINSIAGLSGKVIAVTSPGSSTQYLSQTVLFKAGLTPTNYKILPLGSVPTMVSAFVGGSAQAIVLPSSTVQPLLSEVKGSKILYDYYTQNVPWIGAGVVAYLPWAKQNPTAAVAVLKGLNAALAFLHAHQAAAEPIVTKFAPASSQTADNLQFKYLVDRTPAQLQPVSLTTLESIYATIRDANNGQGPTNAFAKSFLDNTYVEQAVK